MPARKGTPHTIEHNKKISETLRKIHKIKKWGFQKKIVPWMKGKHHTIESRKKMSVALKGRKAWNKGKSHPSSKNLPHLFKVGHKPTENWSIAMKKMRGENHHNYRKHPSQETIEKIRKTLSGRKLTKEHIRNSLRRKRQTSLELKFEQICQKQNLPYKFVGNGAFFIENKNPDFINTNGEKIAVEVFWRGFKTKKCFHGLDLEQWKKERSEIFAKYGWKVIFFDETEVKEEIILKTLKGGE